MFSLRRPPAKRRKPISALSPKVSALLIWSIFWTVTHALVSYGLVVGIHPQNIIKRRLRSQNLRACPSERTF